MKPVMHIPLWRTFLNWVIAVVIGSFVWPLIAAVFDKHMINRFEDAGEVMLISAAVSAMTSFPAMLFLLLANYLLNKKALARAVYIRAHVLVHIALALLTFTVIYLFFAGGRHISGKEFFTFLVLGATYTLTGLTTWAITFGIYRRKVKYETEKREDILDN